MYSCKKCSILVKGEHTVKEIMAVGKLCPACNSEAGRKSIKKFSKQEVARQERNNVIT